MLKNRKKMGFYGKMAGETDLWGELCSPANGAARVRQGEKLKKDCHTDRALLVRGRVVSFMDL